MRTLVEIAKDMGMQLTKGELTSVSTAVSNEYCMRYDRLPERRTLESVCAGRPSRDAAYEYDTDADDWIFEVIESVKDAAWWAAGREKRRLAWHYADRLRKAIETDEVQRVLQEVAGEHVPKYNVQAIRERLQKHLRGETPDEEPENPSQPEEPDVVDTVLSDPRFRKMLDHDWLLSHKRDQHAEKRIDEADERISKVMDVLGRALDVLTTHGQTLQTAMKNQEMAAANQSELADIVARLQHRIERLESASADRYDRFIIPLEN